MKKTLFLVSLVFTSSRLVYAQDTEAQQSARSSQAAIKGSDVPTHLLNSDLVASCLSEKENYDLSINYSKNQVDDQGNFGSCGGYSGVNGLEIAWWRFNRAYQIKNKGLTSADIKLISFFTEPLFLAVKNEYYKRHTGTMASGLLGNADSLTEGIDTESMHLLLLYLLQTKKVKLFEQKQNHTAVCSEVTSELVQVVKDHIDTVRATPKGNELYEKAVNENILNYLDDFFALKIKSVSLRQKIHSEFDGAIQRLSLNRKSLSIRQDFFDQLGAYRIQLPANQRCEAQKLKNIILRLLCAGIPVSVGANVYFNQENALQIGNADKVQDQSAHGMLLSGYTAATEKTPFKFRFRNSHLNQQVVEATPEELCGAILDTGFFLNRGYSFAAITSDFNHIPAGSNESYPIERGYYDKDGLPQWTTEESSFLKVKNPKTKTH